MIVGSGVKEVCLTNNLIAAAPNLEMGSEQMRITKVKCTLVLAHIESLSNVEEGGRS